MTAQADKRRRELAQIHLAAKQLGMDEDTYRGMLERVAGVRSAALLTVAGRQQVLDHLRSAGFKAKPRKRVAQHPGTPHNLSRVEQLQKIEAQLAEMKLSWAYADAIAKRQAGVEKVAWVRQPKHLSAIIAALHVEQEKRALLSEVDDSLRQLGLNREDFAAMNTQLGKGWERNRRTLRQVCSHLSEQITQRALQEH
ncbi:regulatory protein GemA [Natronospirillum operosum]|uniref:Regulatory protein GemA n=1 Tax=Natronospirillum operosum TaxID=2759953 RepID=A0A4Z0WED0_9GAMM|nr:regulatory protein GemA [Natronospirillum operosum]TGG92513.1 regulatory protein GemA [Natronospirillum operosum]